MNLFKNRLCTKLLILIVISCVFWPIISAAAQTSHEIPIQFYYGTKKGKEITQKFTYKSAEALLKLVKIYFPGGDTVFNWNDKTPRLPVQEISLIFTSAEDPDYAFLRQNRPEMNSHADRDLPTSAAFVTKNLQNQSVQIYVFLFMERIFYEENTERLDGNARFLITLAHELYGNVDSYLRMSLEEVANQDKASQLIMQARTYQVGADFIDRIVGGWKREEYNEAIISDLEKMKPGELENMQYIENILGGMGVVQVRNKFTLKKHNELSSITVFSLDGEAQEIGKLYNSEEHFIDLDRLEEGVYIVQMKSAETKKLETVKVNVVH